MNKITINIIRIIPAIILLQTLFYKFSGAEESVYIFTKIGLEPYGRIGIGIAELIAAILILIPKTSVYGALFSMGLMLGALQFHLTKLGIEVLNDGGKLFALALIVFIFCGIIVWLEKNKLIALIRKIKI